ncbi:hypothetical protein D3C79_733200 [compost metagenome]
MLEDAPGVHHHRTVFDLQHITAAPVFQAATGLEQGGSVTFEGENDVVGQVVDASQGYDDAFAHGPVAAVGVGEFAGQVIGQVIVVLEAVEQLNVPDQKVIDQVVEHFAEFVAHCFSLF